MAFVGYLGGVTLVGIAFGIVVVGDIDYCCIVGCWDDMVGSHILETEG